jgi:hypothetical protein
MSKPSSKGYVKKIREKALQGRGDVSLKYMFTDEYWNRADRVVKRMGIPTVNLWKGQFTGYIRGQGVTAGKWRKKFFSDPEGRRLVGSK